MRLTQDGESNQTDSMLDKLIIALLLKNQAQTCDNCKQPLTGYQIHHKRYGEDIGLKDLCLVCGPCHAYLSGIKKHTGTLRYVYDVAQVHV